MPSPPDRSADTAAAPPAGPEPSLALCHEWLRYPHGSEKTFMQMARVFPAADLYALTMSAPGGLDFGGRRVATTFLDRIPPLRDRHALQLPLMPLAWRYATRRRYQVVVTSSHACAKGFRPGRRALHLCYCYTPMRYVWTPDLDRRKRANPLTRVGEAALKRWDLKSVGWVDEFAAISHYVKARIERFYSRPARVIYPPVDTDFYTPGDPSNRRDFAVAVARLVPYKRMDLAIRACRDTGVPLRIAGWGPQEAELRDLAENIGADVRFVTNPTDEQLRELYRSARVCLFPAEEDFGIVPVEAQACGTPVVALGRGGSLETVADGITGAHIAAQTAEDLAAGMQAVFDAGISAEACRQNAERFSQATFHQQFAAWVCSAAEAAGIDLRANG